MTDLLHDIVAASARAGGERTALVSGSKRLSYDELNAEIERFAAALLADGFERFERVAVFLPKTVETIAAIFGTTAAGGIVVPVNPVLKAMQVEHILQDSGATTLVTSADRLDGLAASLERCDAMRRVIVTDRLPKAELPDRITTATWDDLPADGSPGPQKTIDNDVAGIFYTSGSTGKPKGVVLSHRNFVVGAKSVSSYIGNTEDDRILAALPLSFDAGFSQASTAFYVGATVVLHDVFFAADIVKVVEREQITGLTAVPPLWAQIADQKWPESTADHLRYFANTGGKMPRRLLERLREIFRKADPFLMYGLTEAFRSTYLPPSEVDNRPDSIGKAIPNAEILVLRDDGSECDAGETGELVHRGALVALGYWNNPDKTAERFRPYRAMQDGVPQEEMAVWSGDSVRRDEDGFLYFVGRKDDMIKTSGYRVSPTEIEEAGFESGLVGAIAALGVPDERLGQRIVIIASPLEAGGEDTDALLKHMGTSLPTFMLPSEVRWLETLPRGANGKIDRQKLAAELAVSLEDAAS